MSRRSSSKKRCVCCPACGGIVFKGTITDSEHHCPKCGRPVEAWVKDGVVIVYDPSDDRFEESTANRLLSYLDNLQKP